MEYLLGMDIGTTNQKAILTSLDGAIAATASRRNVTFTDGNQAEQDAWLWWSNTLEILKEFEQKLGTGALKRVRGICISGPNRQPAAGGCRGKSPAPSHDLDGQPVCPGAGANSRKGGASEILQPAGGQPAPPFCPASFCGTGTMNRRFLKKPRKSFRPTAS